ncbi:MAG: hypothetical protein KA140_08250 [Caldisericia bacterium]|nr:hypothetical protein [Caldisericia bacterium]
MKKLTALVALLILFQMMPVLQAKAQTTKPPLYLFFIGHIEPCLSDTSFKSQSTDLLWFKQTAEKYGAKITALFNGSHVERAVKAGKTQIFKDLQTSGHEVGTHAHPYIQTGELKWKDVGTQVNRNSSAFDMSIADRVWKDNRYWVDKVVAPSTNKTSCDSAYKWSNEGDFAKKYNYTNTAGQRNEYAISYTGYLAPHPFRPAKVDDTKRVLDEDFTQSFVMFDHYPQLGEPAAHNFFDCTLPTVKADFEKKYNRWKNATGDEAQKIWSFGVLHHPGTIIYRDQVEEFLKYIKTSYLGKKQANGSPEVVWETVSNIRTQFDTWEKANPGKSSWKYIPTTTPPWGGVGSTALRNVSFEDGYKNYRSYWDSKVGTDSSDARTGKHSFKLSSGKFVSSVTQYLNVSNGKYTLSVWTKGDPKGTLKLQAVLGKTGSSQKRTVSSGNIAASTTWKETKLEFDATGWNLNNVSVYFEGKGSILIDDFSLVAAKVSPPKSDNLPKVHLMIVSHNEEPKGKGVNAMDFLGNKELYLKNRNELVKLCKMIKEKGASYNFQSDWNFLKAVDKYDTSDVTSSTNGKNVVKWIKEDMGFSVDAHAHETEYNYADVAYLISKLGVEPSPVVGGFIYDPPESEAWTKLIPGLFGKIYPDYFWKPEILWGAATFLHKGNDERSTGCWRPKDKYNYTVHDDSQRLIHVGSNQVGVVGVTELVQELESGVAPSDGFYTASYFIGQGQITDTQLEKISKDIDTLCDYVKSGRAVWNTVQESANLWKTEYKGKPFRYQISLD